MYGELSYIEKQTILYTKLHFKITDMIEDLKVLTGHQFSLDVEHVELRNMYNFILDLYMKLQHMGYINTTMKQFLVEMFHLKGDTVNITDVVRQLFREIQAVKVAGLNLGEADYCLLSKNIWR